MKHDGHVENPDADRYRTALGGPEIKTTLTRNPHRFYTNQGMHPLRFLPQQEGTSYNKKHIHRITHHSFLLPMICTGFQPLTKNEIKHDSREIGKRSAFMVRIFFALKSFV